MVKTIDINAQTGIETLRDMTAEEEANEKASIKKYKDKMAEEQTKENAKKSTEAKLAALGLTEEEVASILG